MPEPKTPQDFVDKALAEATDARIPKPLFCLPDKVRIALELLVHQFVVPSFSLYRSEKCGWVILGFTEDEKKNFLFFAEKPQEAFEEIGQVPILIVAGPATYASDFYLHCYGGTIAPVESERRAIAKLETDEVRKMYEEKRDSVEVDTYTQPLTEEPSPGHRIPTEEVDEAIDQLERQALLRKAFGGS